MECDAKGLSRVFFDAVRFLATVSLADNEGDFRVRHEVTEVDLVPEPSSVDCEYAVSGLNAQILRETATLNPANQPSPLSSHPAR